MRLHGPLLVGALLLSAGPATAQGPGRQVYAGQELRALGLGRWSEVTDLVSWNAASLEGAVWAVDLHPLAGAPPTWLVDGVPVELPGRGLRWVETLPVPLHDVDSVVVTGPGHVGDGVFAPGGTVHIHTRWADAGAALRATVRTGAETGDPGPHAFTDLASPNVDENGPDGEATLAAAGRRVGLAAFARYARMEVSDPDLRSRFGADTPPHVYARGGGGSLRASVLGGDHRVLYGWFNQIGSVGDAGPVPFPHVDGDVQFLGAAGQVPLGASWSVSYTLSRSNYEVRSSVVQARRTGAHEGGAALVTRRWRGGRALAGAALRQREEETATDDGPAHRERWLLLALGQARGTWSGNVAAAVGVEEDAGLDASGHVAWQPRDGFSAGVVAGWTKPASEELRTPGALWQRRPVAEVRRVGGVVTLQGARTRLGVEAGVGRVSGDDGQGSAAGAGTWAVGSLRGRVELVPAWTLAGAYTLAAPFGDGGGGGPWPRHVLEGSAVWQPSPSFRVSALLRGRSERAYPLPPEQGLGTAPGYTSVDLAGERAFAGERVRLRFTLRNALGAPERHHPAGALFGTRYFVSASVRLP